MKQKAQRNRTITIENEEVEALKTKVCGLPINGDIKNKTICADFFEAVKQLPEKSVDLMVMDPPYNLQKKFGKESFSKMKVDDYTTWLDEVLTLIKPALKDNASIYICGDWFSSVSIYQSAAKFFKVRNRITWEREKGRGAKTNWKNSSEDIWFCTLGDDYVFNVDAVKLRRKVIAPYKKDGKPKDWQETQNGNFRDTHPSNIWNDITIPFWSMPENTEHPTQKSEKSIAKLILASSNKGDVVFDPFLGSGTTSVVAKKLGRTYIGFEADMNYCMLAEKRLAKAEEDKNIQGYENGVFWERNSLNLQKKGNK
jgi:site-specific DNA-methyltransferase (adenine-specific)